MGKTDEIVEKKIGVADNIEVHIWESEEHLPIDPMPRYNEKIAPSTKDLALYSNVILIDQYTQEFHNRTERFANTDVGKPYLRVLALDYANKTVPENRWRCASNDDLFFASLLGEGEPVEELSQRLRMIVQEEKELIATGEQRKRVEGGAMPRSYVIWAYRDLVGNVEEAAKSLGASIIKHN